MDYRIGSIHFLPVSERLVEENMVCIDGSFREYAHSVERHFEGDVRLLVKRFFDTTMKMIEAGGIDIVGHMDKIYMNGQKYEIFNFEEDWYRKPFEACLDLVQEKGLMVEVNTKNWTKKKRALPPCGIPITDAGNEYPCHGELRLPLSGFGERRSQGGF